MQSRVSPRWLNIRFVLIGNARNHEFLATARPRAACVRGRYSITKAHTRKPFCTTTSRKQSGRCSLHRTVSSDPETAGSETRQQREYILTQHSLLPSCTPPHYSLIPHKSVGQVHPAADVERSNTTTSFRINQRTAGGCGMQTYINYKRLDLNRSRHGRSYVCSSSFCNRRIVLLTVGDMFRCWITPTLMIGRAQLCWIVSDLFATHSFTVQGRHLLNKNLILMTTQDAPPTVEGWVTWPDGELILEHVTCC